MKIKKQIKKIDSIFSKKIREKKTYKFHIKQLKRDVKTIKKNFEKGEMRDAHIHTAICTAVENILIWVIISKNLPFNYSNFVRNFRCNLIATAVETPEGREKLAKAMVEPIRRSLDYQAVGRKLFHVEPLPEGAIPKYDKEPVKEKKCKKTKK